MRPQLRLEEITLMPHPLDHWRLALDMLIACAPGTPADVNLHLRDASLGVRSEPQANVHADRLIRQLLIVADTQLTGRRVPASSELRNELGFTRRAPLIGIDFSAHGSREQLPADRPDTEAPGVRVARMELRSNSRQAECAPSVAAQVSLGSLVQQLFEARHEPGHVSAPRSAADESRQRPSGESSCE